MQILSMEIFKLKYFLLFSLHKSVDNLFLGKNNTNVKFNPSNIRNKNTISLLLK